ncbi:MAG: transketolase C-terminal domain-containing protein [Candidatus Margulisiibacteriota bacterium]
MAQQIITMRDALIQKIYQRMGKDEKVVFLAADLGAPKLDALRRDFPDRFFNVGIAEQNLINVSVGFALEGYTVFCYAIAAFLTMRAYEQIRNNISLLASDKELNINLVGLGTGLSYDVSGPSHHCLEDVVVLRNLPNIMFLSPADSIAAEKMVEYSFSVKKPKYFRLDGKPLPTVYGPAQPLDMNKGFAELLHGESVCLVATGYMTHRAIETARLLDQNGIKAGVIDVFRLKPQPASTFVDALDKYDHIITLEEGFIGKGGLDILVMTMMEGKRQKIRRMGFGDNYVFKVGSRDYLHRLCRLDPQSVAESVKSLVGKGELK